jgi:hypothetical protein
MIAPARAAHARTARMRVDMVFSPCCGPELLMGREAVEDCYSEKGEMWMGEQPDLRTTNSFVIHERI